MSRNIVETLLGAAVLAVALGFLAWAYGHSSVGDPGGYSLRAKFDRIDGLDSGADVGVRDQGRQGAVPAARSRRPTAPRSRFSVRNGVQLPSDSSAAIVSSGLLGGKYLSLVPGGDEPVLKDGEEITLTQSSVNLEDLIGRYIFSGQCGQKGRPGRTGRREAPAAPIGLGALLAARTERYRGARRRAGAGRTWSRSCRRWTRSRPGRPAAAADRHGGRPSARLRITARACLKTPPTEPPESAAFLEIKVADPGSATKHRVHRLDVRVQPVSLRARAPGLRCLGPRLRRPARAGARAASAGAAPGGTEPGERRMAAPSGRRRRPKGPAQGRRSGYVGRGRSRPRRSGSGGR